MRKIAAAFLLCGIVCAANAVPAKRGWQTRTQADGVTIEVQQMGDEFYHYLINRDGQQVREVNGMYEVVGETPSTAKVQARRAQARRARKDFGQTPNLAPRGVVILVNFSNKSMNSGHTNATFTELCNSENCTVNSGYPSAREYFKSQSNGAYTPVFDVYGPVTLSKSYSYYGANDDNGDDEYATDAVIEACIKANQQYSDLNFADYDSDNDGKVDFVYVLYAGYGEADGGGDNTIWPHNWSIQELVDGDQYYPDYTKYRKSDTRLDGKYLDNYAMSNELDYNTDGLTGIGTLCHEFGHVMGLPDFYETGSGNNYKNAVTPNDWDVMDGGAYNGDGHCPPNYSPWEKYFFGWHTPINLGNEGQNLTLYANGTADYQAYQITSNGTQQSVTSTTECYYIENRQKTGWDAGLPSHGMLIWKVKYNATAWSNNAPNNDDTSGSPLYTIVSASGTKIGTHSNSDQTAYVYDGPKNPFPGSGKVTSKTIAGKPLLNIAESNKRITLTYIEEPTVVVDPFTITWMSNGAEFATTTSTGKVVLPASEPTPCDGKVFVGWCSQANYSNATTAPSLVKAGDAAIEGVVYYAVFAEQSSGSGATEWNLVTDQSSLRAGDVLVMACNSKGFTAGDISSQIMASVASTFSSDKSQIVSLGNETVELTLGGSAGAWTLSSTSGQLGATAAKKLAWGSGSKTWAITISGGDATIQNTTESYGRFLYNVNNPRFTTYTSNTSASMLLPQLYRKSNGVAYSNYTTTCSGGESLIDAVDEQKPAVRKEIRNGQLIIIRGEESYTLTGVRIQ